MSSGDRSTASASSPEKEQDDAAATCQHVIDAVRNSNIQVLDSYVREYGSPALGSVRDGQGFSLAHWACVSISHGDDTSMLRYLIKQGCGVTERADNPHGAHPIHWACVRGHVRCVELLLAYGEDINVRDGKGVSPLMTAAQYGQTTLATYLLGKGALLQEVDDNGDNALHWAAFKGYTEVVTLFLHSGLSSRVRDVYEQTPLHLACLNGHEDAVRVLCTLGKADTLAKDVNGRTCQDIATARGHDNIVAYLLDEAKRAHARRHFTPLAHLWVILFGSPRKSKAAMLFFVLSILLWGYPLYIFKFIPVTNDSLSIHVLFIIFNTLMWISFYQCYRREPGFVPTNTQEYHAAIKQICDMSSWCSDGGEVISRLCHICRTVKPLRSKHCRICERCVMHYDHHCPWIYNCVGLRNRVAFLSYVISVTAVLGIYLYFTIISIRIQGYTLLNVILLIEALLFTIATVVLTFGVIFQAMMNVTTSEMYEYGRYQSVTSSVTRNPYFSTPCHNVAEFFNLVQPAQATLSPYTHHTGSVV